MDGVLLLKQLLMQQEVIPVILTMTGHGYPNGQSVQGISGVVGMTQLNGNSYYAQ